jgi:hypothetical protein
MDVLGKLFGSESKVKIMRLFLFNPETPFTNRDVAERVKTTLASARHEVSLLRKMRLVKSRAFQRRVVKKQGKRRLFVRKKTWGWVLHSSFPYLAELQRLLIDMSLLKGAELLRRLHPVGRLKLVVIAGIFIQNPDSRVDILLVGERLKRGVLAHVIRSIEAETGRELRYAAFETGEFNYRLSMYDKLIRDILDYPHETVLDRIGLPPLEERQAKNP